MPSPTYVAIAKTVLTGTATDVTFSSIPSTYTDLVLLISAQGTNTGGYFREVEVRINGITSNLYSYTVVRGTGTAAQSYRGSNQTYLGDVLFTEAGNTNVFSNLEIYIPNYAGSTNKIFSSSNALERNNTEGYNVAMAHLLRDTSAISSIKIGPMGFGSINTGSRFDLYGIKNS